MREEHEASRLLDAALALVGRDGTSVDAPGGKVITLEVGGARLLLSGALGRGLGPGNFVLQVDAPATVLEVGWGGGRPIDVRRFVRGSWEQELLQAATERTGPIDPTPDAKAR